MTQSTLQDFESAGVECPTCGRDEFESERGMKYHHSVMHGESIKGWSLTCEVCGEEFHTLQEPEERRFCSSGCTAEAQKDYTECRNCGEQFTGAYNGSAGVFCSRECYSQYNRVVIKCEWCGDERELPKSHKEQKYCSIECKGKAQSENQRGSDNPYWRGGRDFYTRVRANLSDKAWGDIAQGVRGENGYECYQCGQSQSEHGRKLDVHHIIPVMDGGTNDPWNLIPLCNSCHKDVEWFTVNNITGKEPLLSDEISNKHNRPNGGGNGE